MKILAIQNRMGIGDTVIFLPFIKALSKKFDTPISLLVKESSKADQYLYHTNYIDKILLLERDKKNNNRHDGFFGSFNLIKDLRKYNFDKIFIFNSSIRYNLIARFSKISEIFQYPLLQKNKQHIIEAPKKFLKDKLNLVINQDPEIQINNESVKNSFRNFKINKKELNILLGIGGSGPTKRIPAETFLSVIEKISKLRECRFFLATGKNHEEQIILKKIISSNFNSLCVPLDNYTIRETLPIIKSCNISICNDTGFGHLAAALGVKTITLMADAPLIYGSYSSKMFPIIPDGVDTVSHGTNGKDKINANKIFEKLVEILN